MKKLIILFFICGAVLAQDSTFTKADSIIVEDLRAQVKAFEKFQEQLKKEFENSQLIKEYLTNRINAIEQKKTKGIKK